MPRQKRTKTRYPGVYYIEGKPSSGKGHEKIYYIMYRRDGKLIEEKAGRQYQDDMSPAKAAGIRSRRIEKKQPTNTERRQKVRKKVTIQYLADEYFLQKANTKAKITDLGRYNNYLKDSFGKKEPKSMVMLDTDRLRIKLLKTRSPQTVKHVLSLLKRLINFGVDRGLCKHQGFKINLPPVDNIKTEDLSSDQLQRLFVELEKTPYRTAASMMKLALFTGMRRGEIFKLQWGDVDFYHGFIQITEPKGGKSQKIPLNSNARKLLETQPQKDSKYVFPGRYGKPYQNVSHGTKSIKDAAKLPKDFRPFHGLRHVYATMLASSGKVDMYTLQKLMTHKSPQMTQRYAHHRDEALRRAANEVDDILNQSFALDKKDII